MSASQPLRGGDKLGQRQLARLGVEAHVGDRLQRGRRLRAEVRIELVARMADEDRAHRLRPIAFAFAFAARHARGAVGRRRGDRLALDQVGRREDDLVLARRQVGVRARSRARPSPAPSRAPAAAPSSASGSTARRGRGRRCRRSRRRRGTRSAGVAQARHQAERHQVVEGDDAGRRRAQARRSAARWRGRPRRSPSRRIRSARRRRAPARCASGRRPRRRRGSRRSWRRGSSSCRRRWRRRGARWPLSIRCCVASRAASKLSGMTWATRERCPGVAPRS